MSSDQFLFCTFFFWTKLKTNGELEDVCFPVLGFS